MKSLSSKTLAATKDRALASFRAAKRTTSGSRRSSSQAKRRARAWLHTAATT